MIKYKVQLFGDEMLAKCIDTDEMFGSWNVSDLKSETIYYIE